VRRVTRVAALTTGVVLALSACGGGSDPSSDRGGSGELKVGMAFDTGGRGDGTFNDLAAAGLDSVKKDLKARVQELSPDDQGSNRADLLRQLADDGYDPIIAVGFSYSEVTDTVAEEYSDVQFVVIDGGPSTVPNVAVKTFQEEQGSFLVGAVAALKSKTAHVGFIGGNESQLINKFHAGYVQGAKTVDPKIVVDDKRLAPGNSAAGWGDTQGAKVAATAMYQAGADIIYTAAGGSWGGSFPAAAAAPRRWAIGVDADQYNTVGDPELQKIILTSMVKRVDNVVVNSVKEFQGKDKILTGSYGLKDEGVGFSATGGFVDDIKSRIENYEAKIIDGSLTVAPAL
jgi:basic membrane protein A and related proteins